SSPRTSPSVERTGGSCTKALCADSRAPCLNLEAPSYGCRSSVMFRDKSSLIAVVRSRTVNIRWWFRSTLSVAIGGPPVASLLLFAWFFPSASQTPVDRFHIPPYVVAFLLFAVPVGYVYGVVPALLAGATYSAMLSAIPPLRVRPRLRLCVGAVCGGFWAELW